MDGRELRYRDESFDVVLTISAIEHFGTRREIAAAAAEIGRMRRPGGHAVIVTDCFVTLSPIDTLPVWFALRRLTGGRRSGPATRRRRSALAQVFTPAELQSVDRRAVQPATAPAAPDGHLAGDMGAPATADPPRTLGVHVGLHGAVEALTGAADT